MTKRLRGGSVVVGSGVLVLSCVAGLLAAPVVTSADVRAFLGGGRSGKLVYTKFEGLDGFKNGRTLWYVDFDDATLVEKQVVSHNGTEPRNPTVSPDGNWVAYNTWTNGSESELFVCPLAQNATTKSLGQGSQPHWWTKPGTLEDYLIFPMCDIEECWHCVFPSSDQDRCDGTRYNKWGTYSMRIINGQPASAAVQLIPYYTNGGRSRPGDILFAASRGTGTYTVVPPNATTGVTVSANTPFANEEWGCNPSVSPHANAADVKVLWLDEPHTGLYLGRPDGVSPASIAKDGSDGNTKWDTPEYSNDTAFAAAVASPQNVQPPFDVYIVRLTDKKELRVLDGNYEFPYLWVKAPQTGVAPRAQAGAAVVRAGADVRSVDLHGRRVAQSPNAGLIARVDRAGRIRFASAGR